MSFRWDKQVILLTGGTGSFGKKFTEIMLKKYRPKALRIFSRDEAKQVDMMAALGASKDHPVLRFFLGDVRDYSRVRRAMEGATLVVHAAALKQVPLCEYNPFEAVKTNIMGAQNIIDAALDRGVPRVLALSTDKAVNPVNLYGATKLCAEKMFVQGNSYAGGREIRYSCVRYGNVVGSRGSVLPLFLKQRETGTITLTDSRMTRFWLTLDQGVQFVIKCIERMDGGEIFVPKIPSMKMTDMAKAVAPGCKVKVTGIRPGEKIHEVLLSEDEARHAVEEKDMFVIQPEHSWWRSDGRVAKPNLPDGYRYSSDNNRQWINASELKKLMGKV